MFVILQLCLFIPITNNRPCLCKFCLKYIVWSILNNVFHSTYCFFRPKFSNRPNSCSIYVSTFVKPASFFIFSIMLSNSSGWCSGILTMGPGLGIRPKELTLEALDVDIDVSEGSASIVTSNLRLETSTWRGCIGLIRSPFKSPSSNCGNGFGFSCTPGGGEG